MPIGPPELASYAADVVRAFGATTDFQPPANTAAGRAIRVRVRVVLDGVRPQADGPSIGELLGSLTALLTAPLAAPLADDASRGRLEPGRSGRVLAELRATFSQASFRRTKRAQRGRLLAQLIVLFELEPALKIEVATGDDPEGHLRRVRAALR